jgi:hypothetical protein
LKLNLKNKKGSNKIKVSAEKNSIYSLAVTAICLLFHDVTASKISDLKDGPGLVKSLIEKIKDENLKILIEGMTRVNFEDRFSIKDCLEFFDINFKNYIEEFAD